MQEISKNKQNQLTQHNPKGSIQQAFKRFQKQKFYQIKLNKYLRQIKIDRKSEQFKQQLRNKFIQTAKKYIGIPYAQKYHQPKDQLYSSPLFLDCCALIKQCIFDLRQDFGFTLAKWNQSYQYDLLPDNNLTLNDLKPGDLIFYSATYYNKKLKPFPHKMVHVEIYLGEQKTIGARWQKGTINIFNSYQFTSSLYYDIEYHYRSINCWLEGIFVSHCNEHKWMDERNNQWLSQKFSVFADPTLDDIDLKELKKKEIKDIMIGKGNNSKLIKQYFYNDEKYRLMSDKEQFSSNFYYKWVQCVGQIDFYSFRENQQLVNHIANISIISSKLSLLKTIKDYYLQQQNLGKKILIPFEKLLPKTYRLQVMSDQIQFLNDNTSGIWIYKPRNLNQGRGIHLIGNIKQFKQEFICSKKFYLGEYSLNNMLHYKPQLSQISNQGKYSQLKHDGLIQHYIRPLLLDGYKFDIRCYMLIYSQPTLVMFSQGYLRRTISTYNQIDIENQNQLALHLTNNCYQQHQLQYKSKKQDTVQNWSKLIECIGLQKTQQLKQSIKMILLTTFLAARKKLMLKKGTYELLGCDIIVDENHHPYLLQMNTNPALFTPTKVQKQIIPPLIKNTLDIVLDLFQGYSPTQVIQKSHGFDLLYCQATNYMYTNSQSFKQTKEKFT